MNQRRDLSIDTARGLAIIIIVCFHSCNEYYRGAKGTFIIYFLTYCVGLPLFAALSGLVYAKRPVRPGGIPPFLQDKVRRILLPCVMVSTFTYLLQTLAPGVTHPRALASIWEIYVFRFQQFWFLYSIFVVFVIMALIDYGRLMESLSSWLLLLALSSAAAVTLKMNMLSCSGAIYLLPYFLLGCGLVRFADALKNPKLLPAIASVFLVTLVVVPLILWGGLDQALVGPVTLLGLAIGLTGVFTMIGLRKEERVLAWIGSYSYAIYLFHLIGGAVAIRVVRVLMESPSSTTYLAFHFALGLTLPILVQKILARNRYLSFLLLGTRLEPKAPHSVTQSG